MTLLHNNSDEQPTKYQNFAKGVNHLSLGISMVVAVIIGTGIGIWLKNLLESTIWLFVGILWGVAAAVLNVYKAYQQHQKEFEQYAKEEQEVQKTLNKER